MDERKEIKTNLDSTKSERIRNKIRQQYRHKDKQVKRSMKEDKRKWMIEKAQVAPDS